MTALLEYLDLTALLEYIDLVTGIKGPFMRPPGAPFRLGPGANCPSCPPVGGPENTSRKFE